MVVVQLGLQLHLAIPLTTERRSDESVDQLVMRLVSVMQDALRQSAQTVGWTVIDVTVPGIPGQIVASVVND